METSHQIAHDINRLAFNTPLRVKRMETIGSLNESAIGGNFQHSFASETYGNNENFVFETAKVITFNTPLRVKRMETPFG